LRLAALPAATTLLERHVAEHLLDVAAATDERRLLTLGTRHALAHEGVSFLLNAWRQASLPLV
jgi:hypothetical protein